ncbi:hypothetical protein AB0H57_29655 [Micromonospora sp. NPDC050686]|uniref:hypothetical protein n=1 Tax=Micromonospora sp. NPDC050686 TaxID=3154631 RepID=UPI0033D3BC88
MQFAERLNSMPKLAAFTTLNTVERQNPTLIRDFAEELAELKQHSGKHKITISVQHRPPWSRKPWAEVLSDLKSLLATGSSLYA